MARQRDDSVGGKRGVGIVQGEEALGEREASVMC